MTLKTTSHGVMTALMLGILMLTGQSSQAHDEFGGVTLPLTPTPERCVVEPRSLPEVRVLWEAAQSAPVSERPSVADDVSGSPVDHDTIAEVTNVLVGVLACAGNGNDGLREASFLTDDYLSESLSGLSEEEFAGYYTESLEPITSEHWIMLYAIHDMELLEDGRIRLKQDLVVQEIGHFIDTVILEQVDGHWLIDDYQSGGANLYPVTASS